MIRCVIIEDEIAASSHLKSLLKKADSSIEVIAVLESIKSAGEWFGANPHPDLIISDIQIADGLSFGIFENTDIQSPIIFTTAYDEYAIQAFKHNSIDYLLKPIDIEALVFSLAKFRNQTISTGRQVSAITKENPIYRKGYRRSFLVSYKDKLLPLHVDAVSFFYIANSLLYAQLNDGKSYIIDLKMEDLQEQLDPAVFFRANRQFLLSKQSILEIEHYFNNRLILKLNRPTSEQVIISKERVPVFKKWFEEFA